MKKVLIFAVAMLILAAGCGKDNGKTIVISWKKSDAASCKGCEKCGATEAEVNKAVTSLKTKLADRGFKVRAEERKAVPANVKPSEVGIWVCDIPLETWLAAGVGLKPCDPSQGCQMSSCKVLYVDGRTYETVPADMMMRACFLASDQLAENGKIDPAKIKTPKGCAGCPSAGACGMGK